MAFLLGVCGGLKDVANKDLAFQTSPAALKNFRERLINAGLEDSAATLRKELEHELDEARKQLVFQQKGYERKLLPAPSQMLLHDEVDVEEDGFDDDTDVYEFDINGMVL